MVFSGSSTNKTDRHDDITEILLKVALNTIKQTIRYVLFGMMVLLRYVDYVLFGSMVLIRHVKYMYVLFCLMVSKI